MVSGPINLPPLNQQINVVVNSNIPVRGPFSPIIGQAGAATSAVGSFTRSINHAGISFRTYADSLRQFGSLMKYTVVMPIAQVGAQALKLAENFEQSMAQIRGLVGLGEVQVARLGDAVLKMAGEVGRAPQELADALYFITSAGIKDSADALAVLETSAKASASGLGTTIDVADMLTSVMNAYSKGTYEASQANDILVAAVREGKAEASDMGPAMGKVIPVAAAFGVSFEDASAAVAALTRQGSQAGTAAIYLRQVLNTLLDPTEKAKRQLEQYGLSAQSIRQTIQEDGLLNGLMLLKNAFGNNAEAIAQVFGNVRAMQAVFALLGPNLQANIAIFDELNNSAGMGEEAFAAVEETLGQKLREATAQFQASLIQLGDQLVPIVKIIANVGKSFAQFFGFFARNKILVVTAASFAAVAASAGIFIRTMATMARLKSTSTIVLQSLSLGLRDTMTGMTQNIATGQMLSATQRQSATSAMAQAVATRASTATQISHSNSLVKNISLLRAEVAAQRAAAASAGTLATSTKGASAAMSGFMALGGKMLLSFAAPVALMGAITLIPMIFSKLNRGVKESGDEVGKILKGIKSDIDGGLRGGTITLGVDVNYRPLRDVTGSAIQDVFFPKDEEGKLTEQAKKLKKQIDEVITGTPEERTSYAKWFAAQFQQDETSFRQATAFIADKLSLDPSDITSQVRQSTKTIAGLFEIYFQKDMDNVDFSKLKFVQPDQFVVEANKIVDAMPSLTDPLADAIKSGSQQQFAEGLDSITKSLIAQGVRAEFAEFATLRYAQSAFKASNGTAKGSTMVKLLENNLSVLQGPMKKATEGLLDNEEASAKAETGTNGYVSAIREMPQYVNNAADSQSNFVDDLAKTEAATADLKEAFQSGLTPEIQVLVGEMDALDDALKRIKAGQEALLGKSKNLEEAQIDYRDAVRSTVVSLKESGGDFTSGTQAADDAKKNIMGVLDAVTDVGNAVFQATEGNADQKAAAATNAIADAFAESMYNLSKQTGINEKALTDFVINNMGFDPAKVALTFTTPTTVLADGLSTNLQKAVADKMREQQPALSGSIGSGLTDAINKTYELIADPAMSIGEKFIDGWAIGMRNAQPKVDSAVKDVAKNVIRYGQNVLQIKSPSKVAANQIGKPTSQGIAQGVKAQSKKSGSAIRKSIGSMIDIAAGANKGTGTGAKLLKQATLGKKVTKGKMKAGQKYSEGILEGAKNQETPIADLFGKITSQIKNNLDTVAGTINAQLGLKKSQLELAKFKNEAKGFASVEAAAKRKLDQTQAKFGAGSEVTRYEQSQIASQQRDVERAQRDYALGKISYAQLIDAQNQYSDTQASASEVSQELISAENALLEATFNVQNAKLLQTQAEMGVLQSTQSLNEAYINSRILGDNFTGTLNQLGIQAGISTTNIAGFGIATDSLGIQFDTTFSGMATSMSGNLSTIGTSINDFIAGISSQASEFLDLARLETKQTQISNIKWTPQKTTGKTSSKVEKGKTPVLKIPKKKATGGPVMSGIPYIVGELGPELFLPKTSGTIVTSTALERYTRNIARSSSSGVQNPNNNFSITVNNPVPEPASDSIARRMRSMSALGLFG